MVTRRVVSLYEGFFSGGARILHTDVMRGLHERGYEQSVVSINSVTHREGVLQLLENDESYKRLQRADIPVRSLGRKATGAELDYSPFTSAELRDFNKYTADAGLFFSVKEQPVRLLTQTKEGIPAIVGLHRSDPEHQGLALDHLQRAVDRGRVLGCVATAEAARQAYIAQGIPGEIIHLVRNGIDLERFKPSAEDRQRVRRVCDIPEDAPVVAFAARFDPMKDIPLFLESVRIFLSEVAEARVLMCGAGMTLTNPKTHATLGRIFHSSPRLLDRVKLLGIRHDMAAIYNAADIVSSTSLYGETYPLCLMEGLACGAIPVATDVGDSTDIVAEGRGILTSRNPAEIASAWQFAYKQRENFWSAIDASRSRFARDKMVDAYSAIIDRYLLK